MYIAKKPCRFADKQFFIGEQIPDELVAPERAGILVKYGLIEYAEEKPVITPNKPLDGQSGVNHHPENEPRQTAQKPAKTGQGKKAASASGKKVQK